MLKEGSKISNFSLPNQAGKQISATDFKDHNIVLYFYPKDDTPGCTIEAQDFSKLNEAFKDKKTVVLGVSKDSTKSHDKFCSKYNLSIDLLSDEDGSVCEAFGVWVEKSMYGKKYMGIERSTFLIDQNGIIKKAWRNVKVPNHAQEVLNSI